MFDLFRFGVLAIPILNACASRAASMSPAQSTRIQGIEDYIWRRGALSVPSLYLMYQY